MTEFQKQRLEYLIKTSDKCGWVQLGKADVLLLKHNKDELEKQYESGYNQGYKDAQLDSGIEEELRNEDQYQLLNELTK